MNVQVITSIIGVAAANDGMPSIQYAHIAPCTESKSSPRAKLCRTSLLLIPRASYHSSSTYLPKMRVRSLTLCLAGCLVVVVRQTVVFQVDNDMVMPLETRSTP